MKSGETGHFWHRFWAQNSHRFPSASKYSHRFQNRHRFSMVIRVHVPSRKKRNDTTLQNILRKIMHLDLHVQVSYVDVCRSNYSMLDVYVYTYIIIYRHYFQPCGILRNAEKYIIVLCMKKISEAGRPVRTKSNNKKVRTTTAVKISRAREPTQPSILHVRTSRSTT